MITLIPHYTFFTFPTFFSAFLPSLPFFLLPRISLYHPLLSPYHPTPHPGARSSTRKRNVALKLKKYQPQLAERERKISIRLASYMALQKKRSIEKEGGDATKELDTQTLTAAEHGAELEHNDDQKRSLREKGHFFFVHPHAKPDAFPIVSNPDGRVNPYKYEMPAEQKNVSRVTKNQIKKLGGKAKKAKKHFTDLNNL